MQAEFGSLAGKRALVTGASSGIGRAIAVELSRAGAVVAIVGRRASELAETRSVLAGPSWSVVGDVTDAARWPGQLDELMGQAGAFDLFVHSAGLHLKRPSVDSGRADILSLVDVHVASGHEIARRLAPGMMAKKNGHIVFIASMASLIGLPSVAAYSAAKGAVTSLVRCLASEWGGHGVRVNAVAPGWIDTPMLHQAMKADPERLARVLARTPLRRLGRPEEVAAAVRFLCADAGGFITGSVLTVDGGAAIGL